MAYKNNKLYLSDASDQTIKVFNMSGKRLAKYGGAGKDKGRFAFATGLAVNDREQIYVADSNNHRVQVLDRNGTFIRTLNPPAKLKFSLPRAVAIDNESRVYVVDAFNKVGLVFASSGKFLTSFETAGKNDDISLMPNAIATNNKRRRIYVTDKMEGKVSIWTYSQ